MRNINLVAEITFAEIAKSSFNFPITNSIRTSFWLPEGAASTFSEIQIVEGQIEVLKLAKVTIKLLERDFIKDKIKVGQEIRLGLYPTEIAKGQILELKFE